MKVHSGFTLVELLVVIAILAVLGTGFLVMVNPVAQVQKAQDAHRKSDLAQVQRGLELYYHDFGQYPPSGTLVWGASWQPYIALLPKDPNSAKQYVYISSGQAYYLYASLDRGSVDPQACNAGNRCANAGSASCGGVCNYGVSSSNVSP
jgi:general secretion pathway protein G